MAEQAGDVGWGHGEVAGSLIAAMSVAVGHRAYLNSLIKAFGAMAAEAAADSFALRDEVFREAGARLRGDVVAHLLCSFIHHAIASSSSTKKSPSSVA